MKGLLLVCAFGLMMGRLLADDSVDMIYAFDVRNFADIKDHKTNVVYHLDPDLHHLSAIGPDGKLVWKVDSAPGLSKGDPATVQPLKRFFKEGAMIVFVDNRDGRDWDYSYLGKCEDFLVVDFKPDNRSISNETGLIRKSTGEYIWTSASSGDSSDGPRDLQDPKTKVIYHLDKDYHHLSAIRPDGSVLWEVDSDPKESKNNPASVKTLKPHRGLKEGGASIQSINLSVPGDTEEEWASASGVKSEDYLGVLFTNEFGAINKLTGEYVYVHFRGE